MIWLVVIFLYAYDGTVVRTPLERTYNTFSECSTAVKLVKEAIEPYWPNPDAGVKKMDVVCTTERPFGN